MTLHDLQPADLPPHLSAGLPAHLPPIRCGASPEEPGHGDELIAPLHLPPGDPEHAERERLVAEGLLRRAPGGVLVPADLPDTLRVRVAAVRLAVTRARASAPSGRVAAAAIGQRAAVWVYASGDPPRLVDLIIAPGSARPRGLPVRLHEHRLEESDVLLIGPAQVTTPLRTAADVARFLPPEQVGAALAALQRACGIQLVEVLEELRRLSPGRNVARARELVLRWAAIRAG